MTPTGSNPSNPTVISTELLQALVGGNDSSGQRSNAEAYWHSLSSDEICRGLLVFLQEQFSLVFEVGVAAAAAAAAVGRGVPLQLAAILLRQTLSKLSPASLHANVHVVANNAAANVDPLHSSAFPNDSLTNDTATATTTTIRPFWMVTATTLMQLRLQLLQVEQGQQQHLHQPYTAIYRHQPNQTIVVQRRQLRHALEHCVAQLLCTLDVSSEDDHDDAENTNQRSSSGSRSRSGSTGGQLVCSLLSQSPVTRSLWTAVAERAPRAFYHSGVWRTVALPLPSPPPPPTDATRMDEGHDDNSIASCLQCLVAAATAVQDFATTAAAAAVPVVEVAAMGLHWLLPLLPNILAVSRRQENSISNNNQTVITIWSHLSQIAEDVPDLLSHCRIELLDLCLECVDTTGIRLPVVQTFVAFLLSVSDRRRRRCCSTPLDWNSNNYRVSSLVHKSIAACWQTLLGGGGGGGNDSTTQRDSEGWSAAAMEPASLCDNDTIQYANDDDDDDSDDCQHAELLLSQLLRISPDTGLTAVLLPLVSDALSTSTSFPSTPRTTCVALSTLSCAVEAIPVAMTPHMVTVVSAALAMASNSGATMTSSSLAAAAAVHWHAVHLLGVVCESPIMTTHHSPLDETHWTAIVTQLIQSMTHGSTKVAALACQAMVSYSRLCMANSAALAVLTFHVPNFVQALVSGQGPLSSTEHYGGKESCTTMGHVVVQIRAVGSVACVAQVVGPAVWTPYYSIVMPTLWALATRTTASDGLTYERAQLAGSSLEAATMIGQAVSLMADDGTTATRSTLFVSDAHHIMPWILTALEQNQQQSNTGRLLLPRDLLWAACARIASVLEEDFAPYVDHVVPHLLRQAMDAADVEFSEGDASVLAAPTTRRPNVEIDEDRGTESVTMEVPGKGLTKVTINTTKIQEKAQATRAVFELAGALPEIFGPYCEPCFNAFIPLVEFKFSSEIRAAAAQTLEAVFEVACRSGLEIAPVSLPHLLTTIARQMNEEDVDNVEVLHALAVALSNICQSMNAYRFDGQGREMVGRLSKAEVQSVVQHCMHAMVACLKRRDDITSTLASGEGLSGDDERNELQRNLMGEQELLTPLVDSIGYLLKCFGPRFAPIFNAYVVPTLGPYLGSGRDARARLSAICLFDDCVEHCGADAAATFGPNLLVGILHGWNQSDDAELQRSAIYGVAQLARHAPASILTPHARQVAQGLLHLVSSSVNHDFKDNGRAIYENALSALTSLTLFENAPFRTAGLVDQEAVADYFFQSLPLREDEDEAQICHAELCSLLEKGDKLHLWKSDELVRVLHKILSLVNDGEEIATPETCHRLQLILHKMQLSPTSTTECVGLPSSTGFVHLGSL